MIQTCVLRLFHKSASPIKKKKVANDSVKPCAMLLTIKRKHNSPIACYEEKSRDRRIKYTSLLLNAAWENQTIIVVNWSFTLLDYWKFIVCERRELFCFWSRRELFHSKLTRKMLMFLLVFLGNTIWFQMFVIERCLWVFTAFSPKRFLLLLSNLHFAVTKLRNSTSVLHPLYKSSLWNLKWPVCLHITLFALLFLRKTRDWWSDLADKEVNLTGHWGEDDQ